MGGSEIVELEVIHCLPHEHRDELVKRAKEHLSKGTPDTLIYVVPTKRMANNVERELTKDGGFVPLIGTPIAIASELHARAFPGIPVLSSVIEMLVMEQVLVGLWESLEYFSLNRERPSQGLVNQLYGLFRRARARRIKLDEELSGSEKTKDKDIARVFTTYYKRLEEVAASDAAGMMERLVDPGSPPLEGVELVLLDTLPPQPTPMEEDFLKWLCDGSKEAVAREVRCAGMFKVFGGEDPAAVCGSDGSIAGELAANMFRGPHNGDKSEELKEKVFRIDGQERSGEMEAVASKVRDLLDSGEAIPANISVVLADNKPYDGVIDAVFDRHGIPFEMKGQYDLLATGPGRTVVNLLNASLRDLPRQAVVDLASSPYILYKDEAGKPMKASFVQKVAKRSAFTGGKERWARELEIIRSKLEYMAKADPSDTKAREQADNARVQEACINSFLELVSTVASKGKRLTQRDFVAGIRAAIEKLGVRVRSLGPADEVTTRDAAALKRVEAILDTLEQSAEFLGEEQMGSERLVAAFNIIATGSKFGSGLRRSDAVQVISLREAQGTECEHVFICGLSEKDIPRTTFAGALLPHDERVRDMLIDRVRVPGTGVVVQPERDIALQRYRFLMATASASERLYLSHPSTIAENEVISSAFLDELDRRFKILEAPRAGTLRTQRDLLVDAGRSLGEHGDVPVPKLLRLEPDVRTLAVRAVRIERVERWNGKDTPFAGVLADVQLKGKVAARFGDHAFSATEIETYCKCPFSFMARFLLGLREDEDPTAHVTPLTLGNVVHQALFRFLTGLRDRGESPMVADKKEEYSKLLREEVRHAVEHLGGESLSWDVLPGSLLCPGGALDRWIDTECETGGPFPGFRPSHFELGFGKVWGDQDAASLDDAVTLDIDGKKVAFKGKVDRIDAHADGRFVLLDYKTSKKEGAGPGDMVKGHSVQLALYPLLVETASSMPGSPLPPTAAASAFYRVSPKASVMRRYLVAEGEVDDLKEHIKDYKADPDASGVVTRYTSFKNQDDKTVPATLESIQAEVKKKILWSVENIGESKFAPSEDPPSNHCIYCAARHACRNPKAKVARSW